MKIISILFERKRKYNALATVFERSLKAVMPRIDYEIIRIKMPPNVDHKRDTAYAFLAAANYVLKQKKLIAVADIDFLFLKSIEDIQQKQFDIAVTTRNKMKYNTGLWFYRPGVRSAAFVRKWIRYTKKIVDNFCNYEEFSWTHGGIDQASLFWTVGKCPNINLLELPCLTWNATQSEWKHVNEYTKIIHIKSKLRTIIFKKKEIPAELSYLRPFVQKWRSYL